jgi:hypothetical protein
MIEKILMCIVGGVCMVGICGAVIAIMFAGMWAGHMITGSPFWGPIAFSALCLFAFGAVMTWCYQ